MDIGIFFPTKEHGTLPALAERMQQVAALGITSLWMPQSTGFDAITAESAIAQQLPEVRFGTAVVPTYPRHPVMLAAQALTASAATAGRFTLGIGLSHAMTIEGTYGLSYDKPARHMKEYLSVLMPLLEDKAVQFEGETLSGRAQLAIDGPSRPDVLLAALQPLMLRQAGGRADGTITWCTGPKTLEAQIVPEITAAAERAGRPAPRVVVALPTIVTDDDEHGRAMAGEQLAGYGRIPVYRAVLDAEGAEGPADISVVGDERAVTAQIERLFELGATEFMAIPSGNDADRERTLAHLAHLAGR